MTGQQEPPLLPERVTMGLLPYINAHALDEDYAQAAERRKVVDSAKERPRVGRMGAVALAVFAILTVTAAAQTSRDSVSEERERRALIDRVNEGKTGLSEARDQQEELRTSNRELERTLLHNSEDSSGLLAEIELLSLRAGTIPVHGPGVQIVADDAPDAESDRNKVLDSDLQKLVNGLWQAGAEAISINGERLTALSAIRHAGTAITVNFSSLERPYRILAIGDPKTLPARFADTTSGQAWLDLQREVGLRFTMRTGKDLSLPAASVPTLRFANKNDGPGRKDLE